MPNRLADQTSPYLLQHASNPVDWHPWDEEALRLARQQDRPIFLSIGYSACHWCHVMAHESFEDPEIARLLRQHFVSIKVDREERPDLDQIYMEAVMAITGHGGWPMSVFLTPELEPFFGGTYWPPRPRGGMPGFAQVLMAVADAWANRRGELLQQARTLTGYIRQGLEATADAAVPEESDDEPLRAAEAALARTFDRDFGGFGPAPKFPRALDLRLLLRRWRRSRDPHVLEMVTTTLDRMAAGGIYDHLGGGFHRYSVDARWLVPHFEKMLYDNALLAVAYLEAWQVTGRADYAGVVRQTLDYVLRDMTDSQGGLASAEDADSEGEEGKFYVWTPDEIEALLGRERAGTFCYVYDVTRQGNFDSRNIVNRPKTIPQCARILGREPEGLEAELAESRAALLAARSKRVRPGRDDKVLVSWNGLMIDALARCGAALGEARYVDAAAAAADLLLDHVRRGDGRLLHAWRRGHARLDAYLDDYAALAGALVSLYEARFEERWIDEAVLLADLMVAHFDDPQSGGFFFTADDHETLIARKKDLVDSSTPSAAGLATDVLLRLGRLCQREDYLAAARRSLAAARSAMKRIPQGMGQMLLALDTQLGPVPEIVLLGSGDEAVDAGVMADLRRRYIPNKVVAFRNGDDGAEGRSAALAGVFRNKQPVAPGPTLFLCQNFICGCPVTGREAVLAAWAELAGEGT